VQTTINPKIKRMKLIKITLLSIAISTLTNCASGYKLIEPKSINYVSSNETGDVKLEYKYDLLDKKYAKKEFSKGVKLVALKITNDSDKDLTFGKDAKLAYKNGNVDVKSWSPEDRKTYIEGEAANTLNDIEAEDVDFASEKGKKEVNDRIKKLEKLKESLGDEVKFTDKSKINKAIAALKRGLEEN